MADRRLIAIGKKNGSHFDITPVSDAYSPRAVLMIELKRRLKSEVEIAYIESLIDWVVATERGLAQNELLHRLKREVCHGRKHGLGIIA